MLQTNSLAQHVTPEIVSAGQVLAGGNAMDHRRWWRVSVSCVVLAVAWLGAHATVVDPSDACAQESPRTARDDLSPQARKLVQEIAMERANDDDKWQPARLVKEPILRFSDPTRDDTLGGIWIWGDRGRPAAILELYLKVGGDWILVFNNLSGGDVRGQRDGKDWWRKNRSAVELKRLPRAAKPAADARERLSQMKAAARRFKSHEFWDPNNSRYELRLLPQPLHRYDDNEHGLLDGALFAFANGTNPEAILLVEARESAEGVTEWQFGLARLGHAEMHVLLDDEDAWTVPRVGELPANEPYWLAFERGPGR